LLNWGRAEIAAIETQNRSRTVENDETISLALEDVEILSEDIPGWLVASEGAITVALDINVTEDLDDWKA
jgi:isoleucyl-tRNA synthetase